MFIIQGQTAVPIFRVIPESDHILGIPILYARARLIVWNLPKKLIKVSSTVHKGKTTGRLLNQISFALLWQMIQTFPQDKYQFVKVWSKVV